MADVQIFATEEQLAAAGVDHFIALANAAIEQRGRFVVALAGGNTPLRMYASLAELEQRSRVDWSKVTLFQSDERCVPPEHPDSNYRRAKETLIDHLPIPAENIYRMKGELDPQHAAAEYDHTIRDVFGVGAPDETHQLLFDLALVGIGADGHAASLFPGGPELQILDRWAAAVRHRTPPEPLVDRLTLTLPALQRARCMAFLVSGAAKAAVVRQALESGGNAVASALPATLVWPPGERVVWLLDRLAAAELQNP